MLTADSNTELDADTRSPLKIAYNLSLVINKPFNYQ